MRAQSLSTGLRVDDVMPIGPTCTCCRVNLTYGVVSRTQKNFLYGPTTSFLISIGAKFTLCMRTDAVSNVILAKQRAQECGQPPNNCNNPTQYSGYSCCGLSSGRKGMTDLETVGVAWCLPIS